MRCGVTRVNVRRLFMLFKKLDIFSYANVVLSNWLSAVQFLYEIWVILLYRKFKSAFHLKRKEKTLHMSSTHCPYKWGPVRWVPSFGKLSQLCYLHSLQSSLSVDANRNKSHGNGKYWKSNSTMQRSTNISMVALVSYWLTLGVKRIDPTKNAMCLKASWYHIIMTNFTGKCMRYLTFQLLRFYSNFVRHLPSAEPLHFEKSKAQDIV